MSRLQPQEVIIDSVAENEAVTSGVLSTVGAFATWAAASSGEFLLAANEAEAGGIVCAAATVVGTLAVRSAVRARAFRERDLELRGLPKRSPESI